MYHVTCEEVSLPNREDKGIAGEPENKRLRTEKGEGPQWSHFNHAQWLFSESFRHFR